MSGLVPPIAVKSPLPQVGDEWALVLRDGEAPEPGLVETLARAQAGPGADVVTCGVSLDGAERYFGGNPGGLGVLRNDYGTVALVRRRLLDDESTAWPIVGDESWPLLTRLSVGGAKIVSVPLPLVGRTSPLGDLTLEPSDALLVDRRSRACAARSRPVARAARGRPRRGRATPLSAQAHHYRRKRGPWVPGTGGPGTADSLLAVALGSPWASSRATRRPRA